MNDLKRFAIPKSKPVLPFQTVRLAVALFMHLNIKTVVSDNNQPERG